MAISGVTLNLNGIVRGAQALQAAVSAVRNARAEYGVELGRRVPATLHVAEPALRAALAAELPVLCALAKLDPAAAAVEARPQGGLPAADGRVVLVVSEGLEIALPLAGAPLWHPTMLLRSSPGCTVCGGLSACACPDRRRLQGCGCLISSRQACTAP